MKPKIKGKTKKQQTNKKHTSYRYIFLKKKNLN